MYGRFRKRERVDTEIDPEKTYSQRELEEIADQLLRDDTKTEICRSCDQPGSPNGVTRDEPQEDAFDDDGNPLVIQFKEHECANGHKWWDGEGKARSISGENPILFEEHILSRKRREIYCKAGMPDPNIVQGMYNRPHPQGRKVNTEAQRKKHGASYYR
jgi:hypothetical protein